MDNNTLRQKTVLEALTWVGTPWHHAACVKGAGVDCVGLLRGVYNNVGLTDIAASDIPYYPPDIMLHRNEETVLNVIERYGREILDPMPGDVVLWKFGRIFAHAAIVMEWPRVIHAHRPDMMVIAGDGTQGIFSGRETKFFTLIGDE